VKTAEILAPTVIAENRPSSTWLEHDLRVKLSSFVSLTKPRIALLVLVTVAIGFLLGAPGAVSPLRLLLTLVGTGFVAGGASAWNMILERDRDARMRRTASRPLPSGKLSLLEAASFGTIITILGMGILFLGVNGLSAVVAATTFVLYVGVYTPLKPMTTLNTAIGAIPGALPPVIGWAASTGRLGVEPWALFLIMFLWQFPHFLAIAWIYRDDYSRGGHKMLPSADPDGSMTGRQSAWHAFLLLPAGLIPSFIGLGGHWYFAGALALGLFYLYFATRFCLDVNDRTARRLLRASFLYLPLVLLLLLLDPSA
jgi:heme o synthase